MKTTGRNFLIFLLAFLGLGALAGGGSLIIAPDGSLMGMPLSLLNASPFADFMIPGITLFILLGLVPCALTFVLLKKPAWPLAEKLNYYKDMYWGWTGCIYTAFILIGWIQLEMVFIQAVSWLHTFYMFIAAALLFVALLPGVRNLYKKKA